MNRLLLLVAALVFGHGILSAQSTLSVNATAKAQTITGFGGSIAYFENWLTAHPNKAEIYQLVFADLDLGILRIRNTHKYPGATLTNIQEVVQRAGTSLGRPVEVLLTAWSPPATLKAGGIVNGGTLLKTNGQFVYADWAQWWYESIQAFTQAGIAPTYISMQNEPDYENTGWETCIFKPVADATYPGYGVALQALHTKLQSMPGRPKILGPEVTGIGFNNFPNYANALNRTLLDGYAYHLYNGGSPSNPDSFNAALTPIKTSFADKPNIMTEFSGGTWFETAWLIQNCLTNADASGYLYWDLIWGRPYSTGGLVSLENPWERSTWTTPAGYVINPHYYALKHFSKFVSKGYVRVGSTVANLNLRPTAFLSADGSKLVTILLNVASTTQTLSVALDGFSAASVTGVQSVENNYYSALPALTPTGAVTLPARSVTTLVFTKGQTIPVTGVSVTPPAAVLNVGATATFGATVSPANATNKSVTWSSSNPAVATVTPAGVVTGVSSGIATLTATTQSGGFTATATINVTAITIPVTGITVTPPSASVNVGTTTTLVASVSPANATNKTVTWTSSHPTIASVSTSGVVTGIAAGQATITARTQSGGFTASSVITVSTILTPCANPVTITPPFAKNGAGEFCWVTSGTISSINSWNLQLLEINGVNLTNRWSSTLPPRINGKYYIRYVGAFSWSHFELSGSP